jgi:tetratricopeptide (TPR) repeat protein
MLKKQLISALLFFAGINCSMAQDPVQDAFTKSYTLERSGSYYAAIALIKGVYSPSAYEHNLRLGYLSYEAGLHAESMVYYQRAISLKPGSIEPRLGCTYPASLLGKWDEVVKQYEAILKTDPKNSSVNYKLGLIEYNRKNYTAAFRHLQTVVTLYPFDYDGLLMFAWSNLQTGKLKEARALFKKVLLLSPDDRSALEGLALLK